MINHADSGEADRLQRIAAPRGLLGSFVLIMNERMHRECGIDNGPDRGLKAESAAAGPCPCMRMAPAQRSVFYPSVLYISGVAVLCLGRAVKLSGRRLLALHNSVQHPNNLSTSNRTTIHPSDPIDLAPPILVPTILSSPPVPQRHPTLTTTLSPRSRHQTLSNFELSDGALIVHSNSQPTSPTGVVPSSFRLHEVFSHADGARTDRSLERARRTHLQCAF